jgi:hypothetical protein
MDKKLIWLKSTDNMIAVADQIEGYWDVMPVIKEISFPADSRLQVELEDGRQIIMPLDKFPSIQRLSISQRQQWYRYGNGFSFDDTDEVIHIEQILGNFDEYRHEKR